MRILPSLLVLAALAVGSGFSCLTAAEDPHCCAPSPTPNCCMVFGGWSQSGGCSSVCDGMPLPNDPSWKHGTDSHGCTIWVNPGITVPGTPVCGGIPPAEAGADANDASSPDASPD